MKNSPYYPQVELLLRVLPFVNEEKCFALKGGTAINLFHRDMPRLSVDIDLTYLPLEDRTESLKNISGAIDRIADKIKKRIPGTKVLKNARPAKLIVTSGKTQIKIEPNETLRGTVYPVTELNLCKKATDLFAMEMGCRSLSISDLYGGKIIAALDRQHPRDLFDVLLLQQDEGLTAEIRKSAIVYLCSHDGAIHEVLNPRRKNIETLFKTDFEKMTEHPIKVRDLNAALDWLIRDLNKGLTQKERKFLVSLMENAPDWSLLGLPSIEKLPAIQWKLKNISKISDTKRVSLVDELKKVLNI